MPRRLWLMLHEPRIITAVTGAAWGVLIGIGLSALLAPPATIAHELGPTLTVIWAACLLVGGSLGMVGCLPGWWWVERTGIISAITGSIIYLIVVLSLHYAQPGSRLTQAGYILLGILLLVIRWLRIRGAQLDPARGLSPHDH